ncbi:uncharacterized protein LOC106092951 [Stomoxys calcitrans]|uniref:uncharacterized protein LOC106092951 n=1 Tax=Stomoxys calcitrans TaxID=35570 RepID=UPI0027E2C99B|nr:uncharacterized protein LOC106092951 [Stomoxys calcitrans]
MQRQCGPVTFVTRSEIIFRSVRMTPSELRWAVSSDHLHKETKILPGQRHNYKLSEQYLLGCCRRDQPNNHLVDRYPPPRSLKLDLHDLERDVQRYKREPLDQAAYQAGLDNIHADTVADAVNSYRVNVVLGERPPPIVPKKIDLHRQTRGVLVQLRSGRCSRLNFYRARIDADLQDVFPDCNQGPHDTRHLFICPARPTGLRPRSLWTHPILVAEFLGLDTQQNQADER